MDSYAIYRKANQLVRQMETRDPKKIAKELGVWIYEEPAFTNLLGMYTFRWNHRIIILNAEMPEELSKIVIAHELGHDRLHRDKAKASQKGLMEFGLFHTKDIMEYEANAFAAHILIDNDKVCELAKAGYNAEQISKFLHADINLMTIKLQEMNKIGYHLKLPFVPDGCYLKKVHVENNRKIVAN